jgi:hypothetical protein
LPKFSTQSGKAFAEPTWKANARFFIYFREETALPASDHEFAWTTHFVGFKRCLTNRTCGEPPAGATSNFEARPSISMDALATIGRQMRSRFGLERRDLTGGPKCQTTTTL